MLRLLEIVKGCIQLGSTEWEGQAQRERERQRDKQTQRQRDKERKRERVIKLDKSYCLTRPVFVYS